MRYVTLAATVVACATASRVSGQSVAAVVDRMVHAHASYTTGVHNYTLVQRSMGAVSVAYYEREPLDGQPLFRLRGPGRSGYGFTLGDQRVGYGDVVLFGPPLAERGRYSGTDVLDEREVHVLDVEDLTGLRFTGPAGPDEVDFVPSRATIYVDAEHWVPRGFDFDGRAATDEGWRDVGIQARMSDFRETGGLLLPHRTLIRIDRLDAVVNAEARARLEDLRRRLEAMPPVQRALMEEMMAEEMESLRRMMGGDGQPTEIEIVVESVRVNAGPPGRGGGGR